MSFLKAEWRKLAIANYIVDQSVLSEYVPYGTEPDLWNGNCYLSLVGFMFKNTKVLGVKIPFHINFEEVNLRFYVKRVEDGVLKRGVVFIKEIVPKPAITFVANTVYKENYETMPMRHFWKTKSTHQVVEYSWLKNEIVNSFLVNAKNEKSDIGLGSETEFITEHYWGYVKVSDEKTNEYEVTHPRWEKYDVQEHEIDVNFELTYGEKFSFLDKLEPASVMLAEGSEITVENKRVIKK